MQSQPIRDERILEALEACRPAGDDLSQPAMADLADQLATDPELRRLYEGLRRVDAQLVVAFQDVPVPEGLAQRILDRLATASAHEAAATAAQQVSEASEVTDAPPVAQVPARPTRTSRRRLLAAAGLLSTSAVLLVAALIYVNSRSVYDEPTVLREAVDFFSSEVSRPGRLLSEDDPPEDYPISREVRRLPGTRWREVSGFLGRKGIAYDLPGPGDTVRATLYVVKLSVKDLNNSAPPLLPRDTSGYCTAAWQSGKLLYVLVVRGGKRDYDDCLAPLGPVT
jgi:hypothetical protein